MLSRKQLVDARKCASLSCLECGIFKCQGNVCTEIAAQTALELLDKTEAQEKEIEQLKQKYKEACKGRWIFFEEGIEKSKDIEQIISENEQLKAERDEFKSAWEGKCQSYEVANNSYINAEMNLEHMTELYEQLKAQNAAYREALNEIASPIKHLQEEAEKNGCVLDGYMAALIVKEPSYYKDIAKKALEANNKVIGGGQ